MLDSKTNATPFLLHLWCTGASAGEIPAAVQGSVLQSVRRGKVLVLVSPVRGSVGSKAKC